jgi:hypothetical protein
VHSGSETRFVANPSITDILFVLVSFKLRVLSPLLLAQIVVCESSLAKSTTDFAFASSHTLGKLSVLFRGNVGEGFPSDPSKLQCTSCELVNHELVREPISCTCSRSFICSSCCCCCRSCSFCCCYRSSCSFPSWAHVQSHQEDAAIAA